MDEDQGGRAQLQRAGDDLPDVALRPVYRPDTHHLVTDEPVPGVEMEHVEALHDAVRETGMEVVQQSPPVGQDRSRIDVRAERPDHRLAEARDASYRRCVLPTRAGQPPAGSRKRRPQMAELVDQRRGDCLRIADAALLEYASKVLPVDPSRRCTSIPIARRTSVGIPDEEVIIA